MTHPLAWGAALLALTLVPVAAMASDGPYRGDGHLMLTPDQLDWQPVASMGEGASIAVIEGDLAANEPFTIRLRLRDGYQIRPHVHPAYERLTVLEGRLHFAHGDRWDTEAMHVLPVGGVAIMPPGAPMFGLSEGETVIQLHGTGPWGISYIDPDDDPRTR